LSALIGFSRGKVKSSQILLVVWLLTISLDLFFYIISFSGDIILFDFLLIVAAIGVVHGPVLYLYTRSVLDNQYRLSFGHLAHLIPYLVLTAMVFYFQYFSENTITLFNGYIVFKFGAPLSLKVAVWITKIVNMGYLLLSLRAINSCEKNWPNFYSEYYKINLLWLKRFVSGLAVGYLILYTIPPDVFGLYELTDLQVAGLGTVTYALFAFYAAYVNYRQQSDIIGSTISPIDASSETNEVLMKPISGRRYKRSGLSDAKANELVSKVCAFMEKSKPHLNPKITLPDLADALHVSTNHLSQVLNRNLQKNFFTFVNEYRVAEFKNRVLLGHHHNYSLMGVALECGFTSKTTFYTIFKKLTNKTPADYVRELEKEKLIA
ncbi:MAG: helix-turn-helix domain-containing protein, partial [Cyclobacteriaceae bacterium]